MTPESNGAGNGVMAPITKSKEAIKKPVRYLKDSMTGKDGRPSFLKHMIVVSFVMIFGSWLSGLVWSKTTDPIILVVLAIIVLVGTTLLKPEHVVAILRRPNSTYYGDEINTFGKSMGLPESPNAVEQYNPLLRPGQSATPE